MTTPTPSISRLVAVAAADLCVYDQEHSLVAVAGAAMLRAWMVERASHPIDCIAVTVANGAPWELVHLAEADSASSAELDCRARQEWAAMKLAWFIGQALSKDWAAAATALAALAGAADSPMGVSHPENADGDDLEERALISKGEL